jgi:glutamyl-tRNA synthetase
MIDGLGYPRPEYAHLPFVAAPGSKEKLSKRKIKEYLKNPAFKTLYDHGKAIADRLGLQTAADTFNPVIVDFYEQVGYIPDAVVNYLLLLGWAYDDTREDFTRQEMIDLFTLEKVNKAPASFGPDKLWAFQDKYMRRVPVPEKVAKCLPFLQRAGIVANPAPAGVGERLARIVEAADDRIKVFGDILDYAEFFQADDAFAYDEKVFEQRLRKPAQARAVLQKFRQRLADAPGFDPVALEQLMNGFVQSEGIKLADIIHAVRVATTGKGVGFGLFDILAILGRQRCLARIDRTLARA